MKRINKKKKGSIFPKLLVSYFLFALLTVVGIYVGLFLVLLLVSDGNMENMVPSQMIMQDGTLAETVTTAYEAGGWVEKLNEKYEVIEVYGDKKTLNNRYTAEELLSMTRIDDPNSEYLYFYEPMAQGSYLFCYPQASMGITFSYNITAVTSGKQQCALILALFLMLLINGVLISLYIYRKIRRPLKQLTDGMQRMEAGEREFRLSFRAEGEFATLREAFNRMLAHLKREEDEKINLQQDRHQMLLELSHDLKSPIATINNCAFALKEGVVTEEERDKYYQMIASKTNRVNEMADDMFTMLKMESKEYKPQLEAVDFNEFMRQVCAEYYDQLEQAGLEIEIDIPEEPAWIYGDEKLLCRAVGNLLWNVIKYNNTGKRVMVQVSQEDEKVILVVADDGEAIDKTLSSNLFSPFVRGDEARRSISGTGLGLAIAKAVINKHQGEIFYRYEDKRNQFVVCLKQGIE